jgi:hypothetical protein
MGPETCYLGKHGNSHSPGTASDQRRRTWLDPSGASEADLKKRTLTNLYDERPTWLQHLHDRLDRAVWAAYGWAGDDPATVPQEVILERLLALYLERTSTPRAAPIDVPWAAGEPATSLDTEPSA